MREAHCLRWYGHRLPAAEKPASAPDTQWRDQHDASVRIVQSSHPSEIPVPADPPQNHLDEHALVDLDEQFFDDPAALSVFKSESGARPSSRGLGLRSHSRER